ncbi:MULTISPECIES: lipase family protein [unclassified Brenneria]|uniref:lipase family protein n=1 Tax=unclassified Brenneria TaxID=2634434 RepID=UPI0029C44A03|nr:MULTISPECIES: lipase family protein [unclassified Brenneria]MDX5627137.1 lipase family protein [Brenneria sp. L3-3Z]MDX5694708.1 lipase family protein [Brenneria sp. L4-2C]
MTLNGALSGLKDAGILAHAPHGIGILSPKAIFRQYYTDIQFFDTSEGDSPKGETQLFIITNSTQLIVIWRGTETDKLADFVTDGTCRPISCDSIIPGGTAHKGFLDAFELAKKRFSKEFVSVKDDGASEDLFICGHSLGGALALLHAAELKNNTPLLYTYGMPRTFTAETILKLDNITHFRHVNDSDTITSVPPEYELDNYLYDKLGPLGILLGFRKTINQIIIQASGYKYGNPFWHHGKVVLFFKVEQSVVKTRKRPVPWVGAGITIGDNINIIYKQIETYKFYLVPSINDSMACSMEKEQERFIQCLDKADLEKHFPNNTNPDLDSFTNFANHSMTHKYMPFINNQLLELVDPERSLDRVRKRKNFAKN